MEKTFPNSLFGVGTSDGGATLAPPGEFHYCDFRPLSLQLVLGDSDTWVEGTFAGSPGEIEECTPTALDIAGTGALKSENTLSNTQSRTKIRKFS